MTTTAYCVFLTIHFPCVLPLPPTSRKRALFYRLAKGSRTSVILWFHHWRPSTCLLCPFDFLTSANLLPLAMRWSRRMRTTTWDNLSPLFVLYTRENTWCIVGLAEMDLLLWPRTRLFGGQSSIHIWISRHVDVVRGPKSKLDAFYLLGWCSLPRDRWASQPEGLALPTHSLEASSDSPELLWVCSLWFDEEAVSIPIWQPEWTAWLTTQGPGDSSVVMECPGGNAWRSVIPTDQIVESSKVQHW